MVRVVERAMKRHKKKLKPRAAAAIHLCMSSDFHAEVKTLQLTELFRIAHGSSSERQVLRIYAKHNGIEAVGEAPFVPYYKDDPAESLKWLGGLRDPMGDEEIPEDAPRPAKLALELVRADLVGMIVKEPMNKQQLAATRKIWDPRWKSLDSSMVSGCRSFSIPTDLDVFAEKVRETNRQFHVLKLKLGSGDLEHDELIVARARNAAPDAVIFADANGGWSVEEAACIIPEIKRWNLAFIEQPIGHHHSVERWRELRAMLGRCRVPLFADESIQRYHDIDLYQNVVDGVNLKMLKSSGWNETRLMILHARNCNLKIMLGCMIETSIGTTAAAHLAPLVDWIDLDGHLYVANDDYEGIRYDSHGRLLMPDRPGIGVIKREPS